MANDVTYAVHAPTARLPLQIATWRGLPVLGSYNDDGTPDLIGILTPQGECYARRGQLLCQWAGLELELDGPTISALRELFASDLLDRMLALAGWWHDGAPPRYETSAQAGPRPLPPLPATADTCPPAAPAAPGALVGSPPGRS